MIHPASLPPPIATYLRRYARRRRRLALIRRLGACLLAASLFLLAACLADRLRQLPPRGRLILLSVAGAIFLLPLLPAIFRALRRRVDFLATASRVEHRTPRFQQRLQTLVSQHALPAPQRGSPEFLASLLADVSAEIPHARPRKLLPFTSALGPWLWLLVTSLAIFALWPSPWLNLPQLALRLATPWHALDPVTTTHIRVLPGPARVVQGDPLTIEAAVTPPDTAPVTLRVAAPGQTPSLTEMVPTATPGRFAVTLPSLEQDLVFSISAGDAVTPDHAVSVLHRPAVSEIRIRYVYPEYTRRSPLTAVCRDGLVEAPVGSHATLQVSSPEPLRAATLSSPSQVISLRPTDDPHVFQADVVLATDQAYQLDLTSSDGVSARAPTRLLVRPIPDHAPLVRLLQPGDDLRLDPRAVLPLWYQALDDYGVARLVARVQINAAPVREIPIPLTGDARQLDSSFDLDLAPLDLKVGDLVAISLAATDGSGQTTATDPRHILITPRSIDINTYQRLSDLKQSAQLAVALSASLDAAKTAAAPPAGTDPGAALSSLNQDLASAAEAEMLLRQSILRALSRSSSPGLSTALANQADALAACTAACARAASRLNLQSSLDARDRAAIDSALAAARLLQAQLATLAAGEQAAALLADRNNLATALPATQPAASARIRQTLDRARADVAAGARSLGLDPADPQLDARLQALVASSAALVTAAHPVDLSHVAAAWAASLGHPDAADVDLPERLDAAVAAESVRPDSDPVRARDLQLAAKAARATEEAFAMATAQPTTRPAAVDARQAFPAALAALQAEHALTRHPPLQPGPEQQKIHDAAVAARAQMRRWAGEAELLLSAAEAITRAQASANPAPSVPAASAAAEVLRQLRDPLLDAAPAAPATAATASTPSAPSAPTTQPSSPALPQGDLRDRAMAAVQQVQELLTAMPQDLNRLLDAADARRAATQRLEQAGRDVQAATPERQSTARRLAEQARFAAAAAEDNLAAAARSLSATSAADLSLRLQPYNPETASAAQALTTQLGPALQELRQAITAADPAAIDVAAGHTRQAIGQVQDGLRRAQSDLAERDPLVAARWFARAAASSTQPAAPGFSFAPPRPTTSASDTLDAAWASAVHEAAADQLLPGFPSMFNPALTLLDPNVKPLMRTPGGPSGSPSDYTRRRSQSPDPASLRGADPPGYAEALQAYFEALRQAPATTRPASISK